MQPRNPANAQGIDVSHYQGDVRWSEVAAAGIAFAFLKATEGTGGTDDRFGQNLEGALAAGLAVGAYHFFHAGSVPDAIAEADHFIGVIGDFGQLTLPPVLDIESMNGADWNGLAAAALAWLEHVGQACGRRPLVYMNRYYLSMLGEMLAGYEIWLAAYGTDEPEDCGGRVRWTFLQYSQEGRVPGIDGDVDLNEYDGSVEDLFGVKMAVEDADKIIALLGKAYELGVTDLGGQPVDRPEIHRLANEVRKVSGQPEE